MLFILEYHSTNEVDDDGGEISVKNDRLDAGDVGMDDGMDDYFQFDDSIIEKKWIERNKNNINKTKHRIKNKINNYNIQIDLHRIKINNLNKKIERKKIIIKNLKLLIEEM